MSSCFLSEEAYITTGKVDACVGGVDSGLHVFVELEGFADCDAVSPDDSQMDLETSNSAA